MPSRVIVNKMTTQHKASIGITSCFPDVCKTPAPPAPSPVPIPYPNISNSPMASVKVTKRVNDHTQKVVVKGSAYAISNGDNAGVALGVVSNKIMGKSAIKNQSFDVKMEKKGVGRLKDPHGNNSGSNPNGVAPMEGQAPAVGMTPKEQEAACEALAGNQVPDEDRDKVAMDHGMLPQHANAMSSAAMQTGMGATVRKSNKACLGKVQQGFKAKPCGAAGDTIAKRGNLPKGCEGLVGIPYKNNPGKFRGINTSKGLLKAADIDKAAKKMSPAKFQKWLKKKGAMTGDYDLHDVFGKSGRRARDGSRMKKGGSEKRFMNAANDAMGKPWNRKSTKMIQHGPQANVKEFFDNNPRKKKKALAAFGEDKFKRIQQPDVKPKKAPKMKKPLLYFGKSGHMYHIKTEKDLQNLYACNGAKYPEHWK